MCDGFCSNRVLNYNYKINWRGKTDTPGNHDMWVDIVTGNQHLIRDGDTNCGLSK